MAETDQFKKAERGNFGAGRVADKTRRRQRKNRRHHQRQKPVFRQIARAGAGQKLPERIAQKHVDVYRRTGFGENRLRARIGTFWQNNEKVKKPAGASSRFCLNLAVKARGLGDDFCLIPTGASGAKHLRKTGTSLSAKRKRRFNFRPVQKFLRSGT